MKLPRLLARLVCRWRGHDWCVVEEIDLWRAWFECRRCAGQAVRDFPPPRHPNCRCVIVEKEEA